MSEMLESDSFPHLHVVFLSSGNMWAQQWTSIQDLVLPFPDTPSYDVTKTMAEQGYTVQRMFRLSESFFASLGMDNMTDTFWKESMIVKPNDGRIVECHASADDLSSKDCSDFRYACHPYERGRKSMDGGFAYTVSECSHK